MEIAPYLDSHWLSAILETVFAIFIFLLGIPLLFAHIFMPEEIREIYNRRFKSDNIRKIRKFIIWVVLFILIFANHLIKSIIVNECKTCITPVWLLIFNIVILLLFIIFFLHVLSYLKEVFFTKANYFVLLLERIKEEVRSSDSISPAVISDLQIICGATRDPNSRQVYLRYVRLILKEYLHKPDMQDSVLEYFIIAVIKESAIENVSFHNERDLNLIYEINHDIILFSNSAANPFSCRFSLDCLLGVGMLSLKLGKKGLLKNCLSIMYTANDSYYPILDLCYHSLKGNNSEPAVLMGNRYLQKFSGSTDHLEQKFCIRNCITLFAWLCNTGNGQARKYVLEKLKPHINNGSISKNTFDAVIKHYYSFSHDFFTTNAIDELNKACFAEA